MMGTHRSYRAYDVFFTDSAPTGQWGRLQYQVIRGLVADSASGYAGY
jgi:hypothetical protein